MGKISWHGGNRCAAIGRSSLICGKDNLTFSSQVHVVFYCYFYVLCILKTDK